MTRRIETDSGVYPKNTICEVHRRLLDELVLEVKPTNEVLYSRLADLLDQAFIMAKKMGTRMMEYKDMGEDLWEPYTGLNVIVERRKARIAALKEDKP